MATKILPQEFLFQEHLNPIQVQTTVSKELLDDDKLFLPHCKHFNLKAGTVILVQVMNDAKDMLWHEAEFRVIAAVETLHGIQDDYGSRIRPQTSYRIERKSDWWTSAVAPKKEITEEMLIAGQKAADPVVKDSPRVPEEYVPGEGSTKWHPGRKVWEIIVGGEVWTTVERHEGEGKDVYKARALAIAAGSEVKAA